MRLLHFGFRLSVKGAGDPVPAAKEMRPLPVTDGSTAGRGQGGAGS